MQENTNNGREADDSSSETFHDEITKDKIDKHLSDINSTISEEDLKNIRTDIKSPDINVEPERSENAELIEDSIDKDDDKDDDEPKEQMPSPWNELS